VVLIAQAFFLVVQIPLLVAEVVAEVVVVEISFINFLLTLFEKIEMTKLSKILGKRNNKEVILV